MHNKNIPGPQKCDRYQIGHLWVSYNSINAI